MIIIAAAMLSAGCSGDGGAGGDSGDGGRDGGGWLGSGDSGLKAALGKVAATDATRQYVEYGDVAVLGRLAHDGKRFLSLVGYGFSPIAPVSQLMAEELHFDPATMDGALLAGQPPDWSGVLWGDYDVEAVDGALRDRDIPAEKDGEGTRWTSGEDKEINLNGPLTGIARTSELNDIHTAAGTFGYSSTRAGLAAVTAPGDDTLAGDPTMASLGGCLGDVSAAILAAKVKGETTAYGVGVRASDGGAVTEVACFAPDRDPEAMRDRVAKELKDGTAPSTQQPWRELLPGASVDLSGSVVRVTAKPGEDAAVGRVMQMLQTRDLAALAGG
jgi:hypothetical protein